MKKNEKKSLPIFFGVKYETALSGEPFVCS